MEITLLGTGTSHGVPTIDCMLDNYERCPRLVCLKAEKNPRHRRTRASLLVQTERSSVLIDTSQDFYRQMLGNRVKRIDRVLYTHAHADHIYGLPDIRSYCRNQGSAIPIHGSEETLNALKKSFSYVFRPPTFVGGGIPTLDPHILDGPTELDGLPVVPVPVQHGPLNGCRGYRLADIAYVPDVKVIPPTSMDLLRDLDLLIINCLRFRPHASHLSLDETLAYADELRPRRCLLVHMTHDIDYEVDSERLPPWMSFGYDGQRVTA